MSGPSPTAARASEVRERILAEATRLFGMRGYGSASVREVCHAAGVTKPTLYYWFQSKEALFVEAVQAQVSRMTEAVRGALACRCTLDERLRRYVRSHVGAALADPDGIRLILATLHPVGEGQPELDPVAVHMGGVGLVAEALAAAKVSGDLRPDVDPIQAAVSLVGAVNLHILGALHGHPLARDLDACIVRTFLRGVAP